MSDVRERRLGMAAAALAGVVLALFAAAWWPRPPGVELVVLEPQLPEEPVFAAGAPTGAPESWSVPARQSRLETAPVDPGVEAERQAWYAELKQALEDTQAHCGAGPVGLVCEGEVCAMRYIGGDPIGRREMMLEHLRQPKRIAWNAATWMGVVDWRDTPCGQALLASWAGAVSPVWEGEEPHAHCGVKVRVGGRRQRVAARLCNKLAEGRTEMGRYPVRD